MDSDWATGEADEDFDDAPFSSPECDFKAIEQEALEYAAIERFHQNVAAAMFPRIVNVRVEDVQEG